MPARRLTAFDPGAGHLNEEVRAFVDFTVEKFGPGKAPWVET